MERDLMVKVDHVSMRFNLASERVDSLKEYVIKTINVRFPIMNSGR